MVDDQRLLILNTPWDQAGLVAKRNAAVSRRTVSWTASRRRDTFRRIQLGGGTMLAGPTRRWTRATALHLNLRSQVKYGLAPGRRSSPRLEAGADVQRGQGPRTVERGKLADLTFVNATRSRTSTADQRGGRDEGRRYFSVAELEQRSSRPRRRRPPRRRTAWRLRWRIRPQPWWHDMKEMSTAASGTTTEARRRWPLVCLNPRTEFNRVRAVVP